MGIGMSGTALLLVVACVPEDRTVQALVDARAAQLAEDGRMASRLALASGGVAAQVAPLTLAEWTELETLELEPELAEVLGIDEGGLVQANPDTGAIRITWAQAEFSPEIHGRMDIDVLRPQNHVVLGFAQNPGSAPGVYGEASVTIELGSTSDPQERVDFDLRVGRTSQHVDIPARPDQEEDTGTAIEPPVWPQGGSFLPLTGDFRWSRTKKGQAQELTSLDASELDDLSWPVIAASEDWEHLVAVDLARDLQ